MLAAWGEINYNTVEMPDIRLLNPELGGPSLWPYFRRIGRALSNQHLTLLSRLLVGGTFVFAGASKLGHSEELINEINKYQIITGGLASAYGHVLPPLELILGIFVLLGLLLTASSFILWLLLMSFTVAKIAAIAYGLDIEICSCLGPSVPLLTRQGLILDFVLLLLAAQIIFRRGDMLVLGPWLRKWLSGFRPWRTQGSEGSEDDSKAEPQI